jgi:hypothetical protein
MSVVEEPASLASNDQECHVVASQMMQELDLIVLVSTYRSLLAPYLKKLADAFE